MSDDSFAWLQTDQPYNRRHKRGISPAALLDMSEEIRELMTYIMRHEPVTPETVAEALEKDAVEIANHLQLLAVQGWLEMERRGDEQLYRVRLARRRRRALPPGIWQVLENQWQIPIFRIFSDSLLEDFIHRFTLRRYAPGEYLFRAGEWGDTMFVVDEGILELVVPSIQGDEVVMERIRPGGVVGEMAVLLGEKRPFDARACDEVRAWVLNKTDFDHLLAADPAAALVLRHELRRTLRVPAQESAAKLYNPAVIASKGPDHGSGPDRGSGIIADKADWVGIKEIACHLASITHQTVCVLDLRIHQTPHDEAWLPRVHYRAVGDISGKDLSRELATRLDADEWVLLAVSSELNATLLSVVDQVELVLDLTGEELPWLIAASRRRWAVVPERVHYERLARRLAQRTVGLALSGGMARGLAHIGVLRVLEEANIPVDMIAGSGMGAVCGGLYAAGIPLDRLDRLARAGKLNPLTELSWRQRLGAQSHPYDNRPACETIVNLLGDLDFAALPIPFFAVATDLTSGQPVVLDQGSLAEALSVALSPPGLTPAFILQDRFLADGTPLNPLPSDLLERQDANLILASSVIPSQEALHRRSDHAFSDDFDRSIDRSQQSVAESLLGLYDALAQSVYLDRLSFVSLLLTPAVEEFAATAFDHADEIIHRGEEIARQHLSQIRQKIGL